MAAAERSRPARRDGGLSLRSFFLRTARSDLQAGPVDAIVSVPDGLAPGALAGVNPVYGLYTPATAPAAGSALASSHPMQIATTSASALAAAQAVAAHPDVADQLLRAANLDLGDSVHLTRATDVLGVSTYAALEHGERWVRAARPPDGAGAGARDQVRAPRDAVLPEGALRVPRTARHGARRDNGS